MFETFYRICWGRRQLFNKWREEEGKKQKKKKEGGKEKRIETEYTTVDRTQQFSRADGWTDRCKTEAEKKKEKPPCGKGLGMWDMTIGDDDATDRWRYEKAQRE